jgi:GH24 family phage-related lysozyme (muramidase)
MKCRLISLTIVLLVMVGLIAKPTTRQHKIKEHKTITKNYCDSDFEKVIEKLKEWEGFCKDTFVGLAGERLIGYGHLVKDSEIQKYQNGITTKSADKLLRKDLRTSIADVHRRTHLTGKQLLAMSALVFNTGTKILRKSTLVDMAIKNDTLIYDEWIKWCHYKSNGKIYKNEHLLMRRKWEADFYEQGRNDNIASIYVKP